jgi:hypothetical protein
VPRARLPAAPGAGAGARRRRLSHPPPANRAADQIRRRQSSHRPGTLPHHPAPRARPGDRGAAVGVKSASGFLIRLYTAPTSWPS